MKTARKSVLAAIESGDKEKAEAQYRLFVSTVDKAAKSAVIHKNAAGRYKSGLNRALAGLGA